MNDIAISVKNLSKKYRLYDSPQQRLKEALHPFRKKFHREFWALRDVSFDIKRGETIGIIGRNGSGKSTLLQIICSVLMPTAGEVAVDGRISALLELGSGFNQEFTGRENVMLQGITKGFSKDEMEARMPLIEEFAEIGEFIDQPVKIYSSGMFVRLAFSAAINVDPDILVVDEALAVGDAKFQHKCYGKFLEFQKAGKTVVLVTHDMTAIVKHCDITLLLDSGMCLSLGEPEEIVSYYLDILAGIEHKQKKNQGFRLRTESNPSIIGKGSPGLVENFINANPGEDLFSSHYVYNKNEIRHGSLNAEFIDFLLVNQDGEEAASFDYGNIIELYIKIRFNKKISSSHVGFLFNSIDNYPIYGVNTHMLGIPINIQDSGNLYIGKFSIKVKFSSGEYFIDLGYT